MSTPHPFDDDSYGGGGGGNEYVGFRGLGWAFLPWPLARIARMVGVCLKTVGPAVQARMRPC